MATLQISKLGFKSVAHYLIQTRRLHANLDKNVDASNQVSAKRSLPFSDIEAQPKGSLEVDSIHLQSLKPQAEVKSEDELKSEKENKMQSSPNPGSNNKISARRSLLFSDIGAQSGNLNPPEVDDLHGLSKLHSEDKTDDQFKGEKEKELHSMDQEHGHSSNVMESHLKVNKRALPNYQSPDSIAGRLRQRCRKGNSLDDERSPGVNEKISDVKEAVKNISSKNNVEKEKEMHSKEIDKQGADNVASDRSSNLKKKPAPAAEPSLDGIAGRLRSRRKTT